MSEETVIGTMRTVVRRADTGKEVYDTTVFNSEAVLFDLALVGLKVAGVEYEISVHFDPPLCQIPAEPAEEN